MSVIIRCSNEEQHIGRLPTGLLKQAVRPRQIVVVDSGSADATLAIAARFSVRRIAWEVQPYDEDLTGLEDVNWANRAPNRGLAVSCVATAPIIHAHDETWSQLVNRYRREAIAHRRIFHEQRMGIVEATRLGSCQHRGRLVPRRAGWSSHPESDLDPVVQGGPVPVRLSGIRTTRGGTRGLASALLLPKQHPPDAAGGSTAGRATRRL